MSVILYKLFDGSRKEIEVSEEFAAEYVEMERKDKLVERKETRRHQSLDKSLEHGWDVPDSRVEIQAEFEQKEDNIKLHKAIERLLPEQQRLLIDVYFKGKPQVEIAKSEGVTEAAVSRRLARILAQLKKFMI